MSERFVRLTDETGCALFLRASTVVLVEALLPNDDRGDDDNLRSVVHYQSGGRDGLLLLQAQEDPADIVGMLGGEVIEPVRVPARLAS